MIEIGDRKKNGYVDQEDFMLLMKELGLVPDPEDANNENDLERAYKDAKEQSRSHRKTSRRKRHSREKEELK